MRFFVYTLRNDSGFAPNPFHGLCTLACCKPKIRENARVGDWIIGITPKPLGHRLAYAMRVSEVLTFEEFFHAHRFAAKKPVWRPRRPIIERCGDNCYEPRPDGSFRQLPSSHYDHERGREDLAAKSHDLSGRNVLVSDHFSYFGADACPVPEELSFMMPARYHRVNFTKRQTAAILAFIQTLPPGVHGRPRDWTEGDTSWRQRPRCG